MAMKNPDSPADAGRTFEVIKGQVGPFPLGHVFSERQFADLHPLPEDEKIARRVGGDNYHPDLLGRLLALGVVKEVAGATPQETPVGPEGTPPRPVPQPMTAQAQQQQKAAGPAPTAAAPLPSAPQPQQQPQLPRK